MNTSETNPVCGRVAARGLKCAQDYKHLLPESLLSCPWLTPAGAQAPGWNPERMSAGSGSPSVAHTVTGPAGCLGAEITRTGRKLGPTVHRSPHTSELTPRHVKWGDRAHLVGLG